LEESEQSLEDGVEQMRTDEKESLEGRNLRQQDLKRKIGVYLTRDKAIKYMLQDEKKVHMETMMFLQEEIAQREAAQAQLLAETQSHRTLEEQAYQREGAPNRS
jgi:t-SNARE complex subunit (syntaxin)